ncbi:hypothetical protein RIF29_24262 [Crotalaria pallida]|uniref:Uncharacterized protein n=1 Tax=Crotalaria pallida TaxID=3830 RepID=A0AAN9ELN1_CROPI
MGTTTGVSSSKSITTSLASALLEWLLMFFLFIDAVFSYVITKFAGYCKLQTPCLFCSRLDHVLGKEKKGNYWNLICSGHKSDISSLVLCRAHDKLVNAQGLCESCLFSFATIGKSNGETYRLLGEESGSRFDQDPLLGGEGSNARTARCSCCNEQRVLKGYGQRLGSTKSIDSEGANFDVLHAAGNNIHEKKRRAKRSVSFKVAHMRNSQVNPLPHVGYTELKITSDTESESETPLSDDEDDISVPVCGMDDTREDIKVMHGHMEPLIIDLNEDLASAKPRSSASPLDPSQSESIMHLENAEDIHG